MTSRGYDSHHHAIDQLINVYTDSSQDKELMETQEIRVKGYFTNGTVKTQIVATMDADGNLLDIRKIENKDFDSKDNVTLIEITTYSEGTVVVEGLITPDESKTISKQTIDTNSHDRFGNALNQEVRTDYYEEVSDGVWAFVFGESQLVETASSNYDVYGRAILSDVTKYDISGKITGRDQISYDDYDEYGNVSTQTIKNYDVSEAGVVGSMNGIYSVIENVYGNTIAARRGNATRIIIANYDNVGEISKQITNSSDFTHQGHAEQKITESYVKKNGSWIRISKTLVLNEAISPRGDAGVQKITSWHVDASDNEVELSYKEMTNRSYNSQHNVVNQHLSISEEAPIYLDTIKFTERIEITHSSVRGISTEQVKQCFLLTCAVKLP